MASDVMAVRLHLPQIRVLEVIEDSSARLVVGVESTLRRLRCPDCGFKCDRSMTAATRRSAIWGCRGGR